MSSAAIPSSLSSLSGNTGSSGAEVGAEAPEQGHSVWEQWQHTKLEGWFQILYHRYMAV